MHRKKAARKDAKNEPEVDSVVRLDEAYAFFIRRADRMLRVHFLQTLKAAGVDLSREQWFILNRLYHEGALSQVEISNRTIQDRPNITRLVESLQTARLVERSPDPEDGRRQLVRLTRGGRDLVKKLDPIIRAERERVYSGLNETDLHELKRILAVLEANVKQRLDKAD